MNIVDGIIILFLVAAVGRGLRIGFSRQLFSIVGFFLGLLLASWLMPMLFRYFISSEINLILGIVVVFAIAFSMSGIGDSLGSRLKKVTDRSVLKFVESSLGVMVSVTSVLIVVWLLAASLAQLPTTMGDRDIQSSFVVRTMNRIMPTPPTVLAQLKRFVNPEILQGLTVEGRHQVTIPLIASPELQTAADKASASTVKIQGFGCGGILTGSGFVVSEDLVITNAHVVAGVSRPVVYDRNGKHGATPVFFDPGLDVAFLLVRDLAGAPLSLDPEATPKGSVVALLGYPEGGGLTVTPGAVINRVRVLGRDIYDSSINRRMVYEVQADVESGDSGGPMLLASGKVAGMTFAKAVTEDGYGYTIAASEFSDKVEVAKTSNTSVSTQSCAAD